MEAPSTDFHVRVLLLKDPNTSSYRLTYSVMRLADHGYGHLVEDGGHERFVYFEPGYGLRRKTFGGQAGKFSCALSFTSSKTQHLADRNTTVDGPSKEIFIELETSATPFPAATGAP